MDLWISPDGKIKKVILVRGNGSIKPTECCECNLNISDSNIDLDKYKDCVYIIGDSLNEFERYMDIVLQMMEAEECSKITINCKTNLNFTLKLSSFTSKGFIYTWTPQFKYDLALDHKLKGNTLFKASNYIDASHRFNKAIKIVSSIPLNVESPEEEIDGLQITTINLLKATLYNNLASCFLHSNSFEKVRGLCKKVLEHDVENTKAIYKLGVALDELGEYEEAQDVFQKVVELDPENKAAINALKKTKVKVTEGNKKYESIVRQMFK